MKQNFNGATVKKFKKISSTLTFLQKQWKKWIEKFIEMFWKKMKSAHDVQIEDEVRVNSNLLVRCQFFGACSSYINVGRASSRCMFDFGPFFGKIRKIRHFLASEKPKMFFLARNFWVVAARNFLGGQKVF